MTDAFLEHLGTGTTTVSRCWRVVRRDGVSLGFTDHDLPIEFDGTRFEPDTGMTATTIAQSTGLSIDNSEAIGALRSDAISEEDLLAGRFDGAEVTAWLVNWTNPAERKVQFRGTVASWIIEKVTDDNDDDDGDTGAPPLTTGSTGTIIDVIGDDDDDGGSTGSTGSTSGT